MQSSATPKIILPLSGRGGPSPATHFIFHPENPLPLSIHAFLEYTKQHYYALKFAIKNKFGLLYIAQSYVCTIY